MSYKIGSFNCLNFGRGSEKDVWAFADIIIQEHFDIVALQEIRGPAALRRILRILPPYWAGEAEEEVNDFAFIWNTRRIQLANVQTPNGERIYKPRIYKQYRIDKRAGQKDLIRDPYFARFTPCGTVGGLPFEIRIINAHIRFSKLRSEYDENLEDSLSAVAMRRNEFNVLARTIYAKEADKRYGNFMPAYTILLGDYNLNLPRSGTSAPFLEEEISIFEDATVTKRIVTKQEALTTLKNPDKAVSAEAEPGFSSNYDHFTFDSIRFESVRVGCERIDSVQKYCEGDFGRHKKDISDHVPVVMDFDLSN